MKVREIPLFPYFMPLLKETWTLYEGKYFFQLIQKTSDPTTSSESKNLNFQVFFVCLETI